MTAQSILSLSDWATLIRRKKQARAKAKRSEAFGRRVGGVHGSWVTDIAELKQTVLLCNGCDHKFKRIALRYQYERHALFFDEYGGVIGRCDACKEPGKSRIVYNHQSYHGKI